MINPIGHFRVWRELFTKPIWLKSTLEQKVILITLMSMVNFKAKDWEWEGEKFSLQPGQCITSIESIRMNTNGQVSTQNVRTALKRFEKLGFLTNESTKTGRLITLVNWRDYQYVEGEANIDDNKDLTKSQQRANKELTTREEGNKEKKEKKENITDYKSVYDHYMSLKLVPHREYTEAMRESLKKAMKENKLSIEDCKVLLDRHEKIIEITKNNEYPVRKRGFNEFFGQKAKNKKTLICADYMDDGDYYLKYIANKQISKTDNRNKEQIPTLLAMEMDGEFY